MVMRAETPISAPAHDAAPVSDAVRARDEGFSLLQRANRWLIGLAILLAAALTGLTAHAFHAKPASAQTASNAASSAGSGENSGSGSSAPPLQSPSSSPAPAAPAPVPVAPVVSGGS